MVKEHAKNNWALILGGSSGLGLATAKKLAQHGLSIAIVHRTLRNQSQDIEAEFDSIRALAVGFMSFNADAFNNDKRNDIIAELSQAIGSDGSIKMLIHSVAKGNLKPMVGEAGKPELENTDFNLTIDAMAISLYDWTKAIFSAKLFAADARIVSFTSEGNSKAWKNYAAVSAAKVALEAITRNIALEFAPYGIRANCIQAGVTDTASLRMIPGSAELNNYRYNEIPLKGLLSQKMWPM